MYSTCLHCTRDLGRNDAIEAMPVGKRLAFDEAKGRLWIICRHCERWNLTPFESRWEAVEQCERAFRGARTRVSTDQIGLARLRDGTDLVRIGQPLRPEFAAWRYGDQFGRRRRRATLGTVGVAAGVGLVVSGAALAGVAVATAIPVINIVAGVMAVAQQQSALRTRMRLADGRAITPLGPARLLAMPDVPEGWGIEATCLEIDMREADYFNNNPYSVEVYTAIRGLHAMPVLRRLLPRINSAGASRDAVAGGVQMIEAAGGPEHFGAWAARQRQSWARAQTQGDTGSLAHIPVHARLAFEMAVNEDDERRALEGELATLEAAWRAAEDLAKIADRLALPASLDARVAALKARGRTPDAQRDG
jgi:hypothetical protein